MNTNQYLMVFMFKVNHLNALVPELDVLRVHVVSFIINWWQIVYTWSWQSVDLDGCPEESS